MVKRPGSYPKYATRLGRLGVLLAGMGCTSGPDPTGRRLVLLFVDTLRADHLTQLNNYSDATPSIRNLADDSLVFQDARSPAPWTLPSIRAALSGRWPNHWDADSALPQTLTDAGWHTVSLGASPWMDAPWGLEQGWSAHSVRDHALGTSQAEAAIQVLSEQRGNDLAMLVHLMDPHMPYPAAPSPAPLPPSYTAIQLQAASLDEASRAHVRRRYAEQVQAADAAVGAIVRAAGPDATIVLFSDHGEAFWEEGPLDVGHGHALSDTLLQVPLLIRSPGLPPSVITGPRSLVDLDPTLRGLLDLPRDPNVDGMDLLKDPPASRALPAGWTLRGTPIWGVHQEGHTAPLSADNAAGLSEALRLPVVQALRVTPPGVGGTSSVPEVRLTLRHPAGLASVWAADTPGQRVAQPRLEDGVAVLERARGEVLPRAVYVVPGSYAVPAAQGDGAQLSWSVAATREVGGVGERVGPPGREAVLDWVWVPIEE
jgi:hypothetical protein